MDGNGRWAKKRLLPRSAGHRAGAKALEALIDKVNDMGLQYLSVYAFSTENWKRDKGEIDNIMSLLREYMDDYLSKTDNRNVKLKVIGDKTRLDKDLQHKINKIENHTKEKTGLNLIIALNYGGRDEIIRATKNMLNQAIKTGLDLDKIDETYFERFLDTYHIPDPDLLIRTSGEIRLSNFYLWQAAYTEIYSTDVLWPDFNISHLEKAVEVYNGRTRRFGG